VHRREPVQERHRGSNAFLHVAGGQLDAADGVQVSGDHYDWDYQILQDKVELENPPKICLMTMQEMSKFETMTIKLSTAGFSLTNFNKIKFKLVANSTLAYF
jgi:hypothetical protein